VSGPFRLEAPFDAAGDQAQAIEKLVRNFEAGVVAQTLLGVTGSGKTFTVAKVIETLNRPTLVLSHNKTLAAQLYQEFKGFFPHNAVEYFVSYYDYYQPEAYVPSSDTYIEKETSINEEIDRLRLAATRALFERRDVLIVASVSCIYGLGDPAAYYGMLLLLEPGSSPGMDAVLRQRSPTFRIPVHEYELMHERGGNRTSPWLTGAGRKAFDQHRSMPLFWGESFLLTRDLVAR